MQLIGNVVAKIDTMTARDYRDMVKVKAKESREIREKICRKYQRAIGEGKSENDAVQWLMECFGKSERSIRFALSNRPQSAPMASLTDAMVLGNLQKQQENIEVEYKECANELDKIEESIADGQTMYTIEENSTVDNRGKSVSTKTIPAFEARKRIVDRMIALQREFLEHVKKITQKQEALVQVNIGNRISGLSEEELDLQINALEKDKRAVNADFEVEGEEN